MGARHGYGNVNITQRANPSLASISTSCSEGMGISLNIFNLLYFAGCTNRRRLLLEHMKCMNQLATRILSLVLICALLLGIIPPCSAAAADWQDERIEITNGNLHDGNEITLDFRQTKGVSPLSGGSQEEADPGKEPGQIYDDTDVVRVSIVLGSESLLDAGFSTKELTSNSEALSYRASLKQEQARVAAAVERVLCEPLDIQWNLTIAASVISANVPFGKLEELRQLPGIQEILLETRYDPCVMQREEVADPNMATSGDMIGTATAWAAGYTGSGMRIAIIDTGIDTDHQSFSAAALNYALAHEAGLKGMLPEEYAAELDLLDVEEIASVKWGWYLCQCAGGSKGAGRSSQCANYYHEGLW